MRLSTLVVALFLTLEAAAQPEPPQQPLPFSHKRHTEAGMKCKECHANADPGEMMGFPAASKCMACHIEIAKDKPDIRKLAGFAKAKEPIPWVRVYQIPAFVEFSHRVHLTAGATCEKCHGPVAQRDAIAKEASIAMGACMDCHRQNKASNDCTLCHEAR